MGTFFNGIGNATTTERLPKLKDGFVGTVKIARTELKKTRNAGDKLFVEFDIVHTNDNSLHPVGQRYSWGQSLLDVNVAAGALQRFIAAVAGVTNNEQALEALKPQMDSYMDQAVQNPDNNVFIGRLVRVETKQVKTGNQRDFMVHEWSPAV